MTTRAATDYKRGIGVFKTRREVEQALYQLRDRGFNLEQVSVIAPGSDPAIKDSEVEVYTHSQGNHADTGAISGAVAGGTLGIIGGLLVGLGAIAIPGVGPILLAGAEATAIATTLAGTAIGATSGGIIGALIGLGISEDQAKVYNHRLSQGQYILLVTGTPRAVDQIEDILRDQGIEEWHVYDALQVEVTPIINDEISPTVLEHQERAIVTPPEVKPKEVKPKVVHQEHPEILKKEERTIVTPRVETENAIGYDDRQPEVIEHKQRKEIVTTTPPEVKPKVVHKEHPEIMEREERTIINPRVGTENPVESDRQPQMIEREKFEQKQVMNSERQRAIKNYRPEIEEKKVSDDPEIIVIDRRDEKSKHH